MAEKIEEEKGELIDSSAEKEIFSGFPYSFYHIIQPTFSEKEKILSKLLADAINRKTSFTDLEAKIETKKKKSFIEEFNQKIIQEIESKELLTVIPTTEQADSVKEQLSELISEFFSFASEPKLLAQKIADNSIGYYSLSPLMRDSDLEEIMVNGFDRHVFVFHKKHGMCKTNIEIPKDGFINELIKRISRVAGKTFNEEHPLLDARLPDGSRANASFLTVTPFGHSLTIRKFTQIPLSIVDLISNGTISSELASFLWLCVDGINVEPMNIIVTGGSSSGKTTLMNILSNFIRYDKRIITIEDTLELNLGSRENWIQLEARPAIHESKPVTMNDLLKNSLRMRPDRVLVGEVRGEEAQTLFVAMDTGHKGILGTMHSNNSREMTLRFKNAPMNVPEAMLPLLDIAVVMFRTFDKEKGIVRRVKEVAEISRMDDKVLLSNIFEWSPKTDKIQRTDVPSATLDDLAQKINLSKKELMNEMLVRQRILEWMLESNIRSNPEVEKIIQKYYSNPSELLKEVSNF